VLDVLDADPDGLDDRHDQRPQRNRSHVVPVVWLAGDESTSEREDDLGCDWQVKRLREESWGKSDGKGRGKSVKKCVQKEDSGGRACAETTQREQGDKEALGVSSMTQNRVSGDLLNSVHEYEYDGTHRIKIQIDLKKPSWILPPAPCASLSFSKNSFGRSCVKYLSRRKAEVFENKSSFRIV
jgi:hypothetical protein